MSGRRPEDTPFARLLPTLEEIFADYLLDDDAPELDEHERAIAKRAFKLGSASTIAFLAASPSFKLDMYFHAMRDLDETAVRGWLVDHLVAKWEADRASAVERFLHDIPRRDDPEDAEKHERTEEPR
jgi:hypothetical protein